MDAITEGVIETYSTEIPVLRRKIAYQSVICHLVWVISDVNTLTTQQQIN